MTSKLSVYAKPTHGNDWLTYVERLKPFDVLLLNADIQQASDVHRVSPESEITIRRWDWDDGRTQQNPHGVYLDLKVDPVGLANRHVEAYSRLVDEWEGEARRRGIPFPPREKIVVHLVNEPDTNSLLPQISSYTVAAAYGLAEHRLRVDGLNLSTGHPAILKANRADWSLLLPALEALQQTNGYAVVHEYFNKAGITHGDLNPWHILRHLWMPKGPRIKIGEFGLDQILNSAEPEHQGWIDRLSPEEMIEATKWYLGNVGPNVVAVRIFMTDFEDRKWRTFDTTPIHDQLVALGQQFPSPDVKTRPVVVTTMPFVSGGAMSQNPTAVISVPAGANIRQGPSISWGIVEALPTNTELAVIGRNREYSWWKVEYEGKQGWVSDTVVSVSNVRDVPVVPDPDSVPAPQPIHVAPTSGIIDPVTALAFLQVESGNKAFTNGFLTIRFEVHVFSQKLNNEALFNRHFKFTPRNYAEQYWRADPNGQWVNAHGAMTERHKLLAFARSLNDQAALESTGMGMAQIMGLNHKRVGYRTAAAMFNAFSHPKFGVNAQVMGFVNYVLSDPALFRALQQREWYPAVTAYNGDGQQELYMGLLENAVREVEGALAG